MHSLKDHKQGKDVPLLPFLLNIVLDVLASTIKQLKEIKGPQIRKKKVILSLLTNNVAIHVRNPRKSAKNIQIS